MMTSRLHGDIAGTLSTRRGHSSQLSISDPSHHVTEAIGNLYDEDEDLTTETSLSLSFVADLACQEPAPQSQHQHNDKPLSSNKLSNLFTQSVSDQHTQPKSYNDKGGSKSSQIGLTIENNQWSDQDQDIRPLTSPTLSLREVHAHTSGQQFPLTNIDNPNDIAQELSNLQALRRLSMDVGNSIDPDIPPMSLATMPAIAPRGDDDENDPSRLLWVPARVHPELAPTEFKTFLASRLQSIRRRSGDSFLSVSDERYGNESDPINSSSLRRKKSLLSRQIDNSEERAFEGFTDGIERSDKYGSKNDRQDRELSLDELVKDPTKAVQRLAQESHSYSGSLETGMDDIPILPLAPSSGLRRSTRTTYRKGGSLRFGDKTSFSKRMAQRQQSGEAIDTPVPSTGDVPLGYPLVKVQPEPTSDNSLRPNQSDRRKDRFSQEPAAASTNLDTSSSRQSQPPARGSSAQSSAFANEIITSDELSTSEDNWHLETSPQRSSCQPIIVTSEIGLASTTENFGEDSPGRSDYHSPPGNVRSENNDLPISAKQSIPTMVQALSGASNGNANRVDYSTLAPPHTRDDKKLDKKSRKEKDDDSHYSPRSGIAWKWLKGVADDRDKKKDESKKSRQKSLSEKVQDNVRLDVIQTSIEKTATKGRESLVLDREGFDNKFPDERKKESSRKSDSKKEKDGSLFSSIFGGGKKREEKEKNKKYQQLLHVPEDIVSYKPLQPDIDYNWSRFPLLEERAIYRMAHIKLANPRRSLHSQVLLSNFMYSYLAIVQAMHPQMNVPVSPQQKRLEEEARRKREEQEYLNQRDAQDKQDEQDEHQSLDNYDFNYHRMTVQYADSCSDKPVEYVDDAQIYEDDHTHHSHGGYGDGDAGGYSHEVRDYFRYHNDASDRHNGQDGM